VNGFRSMKRLHVDTADHLSQLRAYLHSCDPHGTSISRTKTRIQSAFRLSTDDTDNEDLDTFSDLNSMRYNQKIVRASPSVDEDLTHTDSRLLSSSGYQSLDHSNKFYNERKSILSKSHSENDLVHASWNKADTQMNYHHYCSNCLCSPISTVIPTVPVTLTAIPNESSSLIQRIQQPLGIMLMKYLNFILISKNVLLLPLLMFLLRQRSM
jgi:hypothetical protein